MSSQSPDRKTCTIDMKLRKKRLHLYGNTTQFNIRLILPQSYGKGLLNTMVKKLPCLRFLRHINDHLPLFLSSLCSGLEASVDLTAGYAWSPQQWSSCGPPSRVSAAVPALLPSVSAARFSARLGLHVCYELLLLLHPLLGSCVCVCCILLSNVLHSGLHGSAALLPGAQEL